VRRASFRQTYLVEREAASPAQQPLSLVSYSQQQSAANATSNIKYVRVLAAKPRAPRASCCRLRSYCWVPSSSTSVSESSAASGGELLSGCAFALAKLPFCVLFLVFGSFWVFFVAVRCLSKSFARAPYRE